MNNFLFQTLGRRKVSIRLIFDEKSNKIIGDLSQKYLKNKFAVIHNGTMIMAPSIKNIIKNQENRHQF